MEKNSDGTHNEQAKLHGSNITEITVGKMGDIPGKASNNNDELAIFNDEKAKRKAIEIASIIVEQIFP